MYIHCKLYWEDMELMLSNFAKGIYPIDIGCKHPTPCPICIAINHPSVSGNRIIMDQ